MNTQANTTPIRQGDTIDLVDVNGRRSIAFAPHGPAIDLYVPEKELVSVRGRVTIDGRPATGYTVRRARTGAISSIDEHGNYELTSVRFAQLGLRVQDTEGKEISTTWINDEGGARITHDIAIHYASLAGRVLGVDGRPLQSISVTWQSRSGNRTALSNDDGHFDFGRCVAGSGQLRAWWQTTLGERSQALVEVELSPGAHERVELQMQRIE